MPVTMRGQSFQFLAETYDNNFIHAYQPTI